MIYIFDLGGVIAISEDIEKIYINLEADVDFETFKKIWWEDKDVIDAHLGLIEDEIVFRKILKKIKSNVSYKEFVEMFYSKVELHKETINIIYNLKKQNKKIYLLSNLRKIDFECFKRFFDTTIFDGLFLSYEMKMLKPHSNIYENVIETLQCKPSDIYFFDDSLKNVIGAKNCGINAFQVTGNEIKELMNSEGLL